MEYSSPCPANPILTHTWGDCFNNPETILQLAGMLENSIEAGKPDVVCTILFKEDVEVDMDITIFVT